jgi:hypothetical protein
MIYIYIYIYINIFISSEMERILTPIVPCLYIYIYIYILKKKNLMRDIIIIFYVMYLLENSNGDFELQIFKARLLIY